MEKEVLEKTTKTDSFMELNNNFDFNFAIKEEVIDDAIRLYYQAFRNKLNTFVGEKKLGHEVIKKDLQRDRAITAYDNEELIAIAGLSFENRSLLDLETFTFIFEQGLFSGIYHSILFHFMKKATKEGEIRIDGITVKHNYRGMKIGSQLVDLVIAFAKGKKFEQITLDVVNTNFRAKQLFEAFDFEVEKETNVNFFKNQLGYSSYYTMVKKLDTRKFNIKLKVK